MAVPLAGPGRAFEREVVRLGAARREDDLARLGAEPGRDPLVRLVEGRPGRAAERMRRRRIAEGLRQVREHRIEDLAPERGRRRVVEIDRHRADCTLGRPGVLHEGSRAPSLVSYGA